MAEFYVNDTKLYYEVHGDSQEKEAIAFFNGVMASTNSWQLLYPIFEKFGYKIILHDFKGQLKSDKPQGPYDFDQHCFEAKALFKHLGLEKVHLVGTSYGGEVAMKFAILYPEMVKSISVIDSVSELDPLLKAFISSWKSLCNTNDGESFFWGMVPSIYGPEFIDKNETLLRGRAEAIKENPYNYLQGQKILYDSFLNNVTMTKELSKIKCPALIICGELDILKPMKFSKIIADKIPNSEYVILPDCGHVAIFEKAKELESLVLGFILKNSK